MPVAVIRASELWDAMEPELLTTATAVLEPTIAEENNNDDEEGEEEVVEEETEEAQDDRATAVQIAQLLRVNKYR